MAEPNITEQLASLDAAIASGQLTVRHGDRLVTYREIDQLLKARNALLRIHAGNRPSYSVARFDDE